MTRHRAIVAAAAVMSFGTAALVGCGLPASDGFDSFADDPNALDLAATSTTSTTTTLASTVPPSEPTIAETTTTAPGLATERVRLYYVSSLQSGRQLRETFTEFRQGATPIEILNLLEAGVPEGDPGVGLQTLLPRGLTRRVDQGENSYTVVVDLDSSAWNRIAQANLRRVIGQIVLTLTRQPGIGVVRFTLDGEPLSVFLGSGEQSEEGAGVTFADYEVLLTSPEPDSPETTVTATTGSVPS
jgi:hypothetical protein